MHKRPAIFTVGFAEYSLYRFRMSEDFDWNAVDESLLTPSVQAVAVYLNAKGDLVIRQQAAWDEDADSFVVLPIGVVPKLIQRLQELAGTQS